MRPTQLRRLDMNLLVVADALLETCSVTETAELVGLSQPAVSRALGRLRDELADPLLVRDGRGLVPTPFASSLRPRLRASLLDLERTLAHDGPALLDVVTERQELSMPPAIEAAQVKGFALYAIRTVMSGRGDELLDLAKANWRQLF